jgi:hypothetical protein
MTTSPILASDTTAAFLGLTVIVLIIITTGLSLVIASASIAVNCTTGRRRLWGLLLAVAPLPFAAAALFLSFSVQGEPTIAGFPNRVLIPFSAAPVICVLISLLLWTRATIPRK